LSVTSPLLDRNWANEDCATDRLPAAIDAYGDAFVRYLIETYKPDHSTALAVKSFN
jgi:hypothetical protein